MLVDFILDRYDGFIDYTPEKLLNYTNCTTYEEIHGKIKAALNYSTDDSQINLTEIKEYRIRKALTEYILPEYNLNIIKFILDARWTVSEPAHDWHDEIKL